MQDLDGKLIIHVENIPDHTHHVHLCAIEVVAAVLSAHSRVDARPASLCA